MPGFPDLTALEPGVLVAAAVALVFLQTALVVGVVIPGGKAAFLAGLTAGLGHVPLWVSYSGIAAAIISGSTVGYLLGRSQGPRVLSHRLLAQRQARVESAQSLLRRRALVAMIVGRYVAALRAILPALAGASGISPTRYQVGNVLGGFAWAGVSVGSGYFGGASLLEFARSSPATWGGAALVAVAIGAAVLVLRHRSDPARPAD